MSKIEGKTINSKILRRTLSFVAPYRGTFITTCVITILLSFMAPVRTLLIKYAIDDNIQNGDKEGLKEIIIFLVILLVVHALMQFFQAYLANWLGQSVVLDLRKKLFKHVISFRLKYFDNTPIGSLVTRVTSDIQTINEVFSSGLLNIISDILQLTVVLVFMFMINYKLTLIVLIPVPVLIISTILFKRIIEIAFKRVRIKVAEINTFVQEHVTGMNIVQIFNREEEEMRRFKAVNEEHRDGWLKTVWANAIFFPVVEILSAASIGLLVWWGARGVISGFAQIGDVMAFILFIHMMYRPIRQLADRFNTLQMGMIAADRVFKILDTDAHISNEGKITEALIQGHINFSNVWFAYKDADYVLKDISMEVKPGQTLALVGATGAGKSSVINVLTKFYEINKGDITIDGVNINDFTLEYLRRVTAVVLQDVFLFNDSIFNNISLLNELITRKQVEDAAKLIGVHEFIMDLPGGYDYIVKERGVMLSAGQRQLLSFLRAYVYNPQILILDEATSSIDTNSEQLIQVAIDRLTKGRTSIVIAHRLSTIKNADHIIVLEKGEIVEFGSHNKLLAKKGYYKKLYDYQFKNPS
jgi:ATP-binding cassette subfamily B multidrug efflux pump